MNKKVLIYLDHHESCGFDSAISHIKDGDDVYILNCDKKIGHCLANPYCCNIQCNYCHYIKKSMLKEHIKGNYHNLYISDFISTEMEKQCNTHVFTYYSIQELKNITFHGVEIGYGAFSTYVTLTRVCTPLYCNEFKKYIDKILRAEMLMTLALEQLIQVVHPELIYFHNGRFAQHKPIYCIARNLKIDFYCMELCRSEDGTLLKDYTFNDIPHSIKAMYNKIIRDWDEADPKSRGKIAISFFEKRRYGKFAGDKVYTGEQIKDHLPYDWNNTKENITIFNSSEDEYISISREYDNSKLYQNQFIALKSIFEHYKNDTNKHFYVRIHPNLKNVYDVSHKSLYTLNYRNVTIISPNSPVSSYTLMDNSSKIIVFNSTIGAESVYWRKSVIALNLCAYSPLDIVYSPKTETELFSLIDNSQLLCKYNENLLKYGFYLMKENYPKLSFMSDTIYEKRILGIKSIPIDTAFKLWNSSLLFSLVTFGINYCAKHIPFISLFKKLPNKTATWT